MNVWPSLIQPFLNEFGFLLETVLQLAPNRKRIHTAVDSSGDEETSEKTELTVKEKEGRLIAVKKALPECDTMVNLCILSSDR